MLIILTVNFIFSTNENDLSHSAWMTLKDGVNPCSFSSSHIFWAGQTNPLFLSNSSSRPPSPWGEHIQFMDHCFQGNHSFIICSSLLDQLILEASNRMFNSSSDISNSFLLFVRLTVQGILSQADIKDFETQTIFLLTHLFFSFSKYNKGNRTDQPRYLRL